MTEEAVVFGKHSSLIGIATDPDREFKNARTAVILLNAGIVHRVGAGRLYVKLARALASIGVATLRFDFSGIGDSAIRTDTLQFAESAVAEARDAMDFLATKRGVEDFILLGGCSGARVALNTACTDHRVKGALLINYPTIDDSDDEIHSSTERSAFFYYHKSALFSPGSWTRLFTGNANYKQLIRSIWWKISHSIVSDENDLRQGAEFQLGLQRIVERKIHVVFICSEGDHRLEDLRAAGGKQFKRLCASGKIALQIMKGSDHTFSSLYDQTQLINAALKRIDLMVRIGRQCAETIAIVNSPRALSHQLQS